MPIRTEFEFTLPRGYIDGEGRVHKKGIMRPATAIGNSRGVLGARDRDHLPG